MNFCLVFPTEDGETTGVEGLGFTAAGGSAPAFLTVEEFVSDIGCYVFCIINLEEKRKWSNPGYSATAKNTDMRTNTLNHLRVLSLIFENEAKMLHQHCEIFFFAPQR
jgi:hypothetical protein